MAWFRSPPSPPAGPAATVGVLLVNLGTPDAPSYWPIRRYLWAFLGDRRVVEACPWYWLPLLAGPILTFRPRKTARLYRSIWTEAGSPLLLYTRGLAEGLGRALEATGARVEFGMSYGEPNITAAIERLLGAGVERLVVVPLYPQYSGSTTGAVFDGVTAALSAYRVLPELRFVRDYHDDEAYIAALAESVQAVFTAKGRTHLLCSFHGIPEKYVAKGDPYQAQAVRTTALLGRALDLSADDISLSFQSRFGPTEWLKPYTDDHLLDLVKRGIRRVTVVTPAFAVDCLETLEEIAEESRDKFLAAGGESFVLVPALNDSPLQVRWLEAYVRRQATGWPGFAG